MKKLILVLVLVCLTATFALADSFFIRNSTQSTFLYIFVSDSRLSSWGDDLLGNQVLSPGESLQIETAIPINNTSWDIRIVDDDGDTYTLFSRRINNEATISISYSDLD